MQRRQSAARDHVVAIHDLDCAWRRGSGRRRSGGRSERCGGRLGFARRLWTIARVLGRASMTGPVACGRDSLHAHMSAQPVTARCASHAAIISQRMQNGECTPAARQTCKRRNRRPRGCVPAAEARYTAIQASAARAKRPCGRLRPLAPAKRQEHAPAMCTRSPDPPRWVFVPLHRAAIRRCGGRRRGVRVEPPVRAGPPTTQITGNLRCHSRTWDEPETRAASQPHGGCLPRGRPTGRARRLRRPAAECWHVASVRAGAFPSRVPRRPGGRALPRGAPAVALPRPAAAFGRGDGPHTRCGPTHALAADDASRRRSCRAYSPSSEHPQLLLVLSARSEAGRTHAARPASA